MRIISMKTILSYDYFNLVDAPQASTYVYIIYHIHIFII